MGENVVGLNAAKNVTAMVITLILIIS